MSIKDVTKRIQSFLESEEPAVICLKGNAGTGKTFLWKKCLQEIRENKLIKFESYSYISLFGEGSLQDIKLRILLELEPLNNIKNSKWLNNLFWLKKLIRKYSYITDLVADYRKILTLMGFNKLSKSIICIDDIERKNKQIIFDKL